MCSRKLRGGVGTCVPTFALIASCFYCDCVRFCCYLSHYRRLLLYFVSFLPFKRPTYYCFCHSPRCLYDAALLAWYKQLLSLLLLSVVFVVTCADCCYSLRAIYNAESVPTSLKIIFTFKNNKLYFIAKTQFTHCSQPVTSRQWQGNAYVVLL